MTTAETSAGFKLQYLLKPDSSNGPKWHKDIVNYSVTTLPRLGRTVADELKDYPNLDTDPAYSMNTTIMMESYGFHDIADFPDALKHSAIIEAKKNRAALMIERQRLSNVIVASLEEVTRTKLFNNREFCTARNDSDPLKMLSIIDTVITVPDAQNQIIVQRRKLGNIVVTDIEKDGANLSEEWNTYTFFRNRKLRGPPSQDEQHEHVTAFLNALDERFNLFKQTTFMAMQNSPSEVLFLEIIGKAQEFAKQMNISYQPVPRQPPPPTVMYTGRDHGKPKACRTCGSRNHKRIDCDVTNPKCDICEKAGEPEWVVRGHITAAHRGARNAHHRDRKDAPRDQAPKGTPTRKVNFADQEKDSDWDDDATAYHLNALCLSATRTKPPTSDGTRDFDVEPVPGDGNCAYESIGRATGQDYQHLRLQTAAFLRQNLEGPILQGSELTWGLALTAVNEGRDTDDILNAIERHQYGGDVEIRALERVLHRGIRIYERNGSGLRVLSGEGYVDDNPLCLLWQRGVSEAGNHYDLLRPTDPVHAQRKMSYLSAAQKGMSVTHSRVSHPGTKKSTNTLSGERARNTPAPSNGRVALPALAAHDTSKMGDHGQRLRRLRFFLDSGATDNLLTPEVCSPDADATSTSVTGIAGSIPARAGFHHVFGHSLVGDDSLGGNLISMSQLRKTYDIRYLPEPDEFVAKRGPITLVFERRGGLYELRDPEAVLLAAQPTSRVGRALLAVPRTVGPETVAPTRDRVASMRRVVELHDALHHPSDDVLARSLGSSFDHSCSASDLRQARQHYGPCTSCLAGKSTAPPAPPSDGIPPAAGTSIHVDLFFSEMGEARKSPVLLAVDEATNLIAIRTINDRRATTLANELTRLISDLNLQSGKKVASVRADAETGFQALADDLTDIGVKLRIMPAERHTRLAERVIRDLKDHMRCTLAGIPFQLPAKLRPQLIADTVMARNVVSHHRSKQSPRELFTGKRPDVARDFEHAFGTVGFCGVTGLATKDDMHPRSELAVVVGHYRDEKGALMVWLPRSGRVVKRHSIHKLPVTDEIIAEINNATVHPLVVTDEPFALQQDFTGASTDETSQLTGAIDADSQTERTHELLYPTPAPVLEQLPAPVAPPASPDTHATENSGAGEPAETASAPPATGSESSLAKPRSRVVHQRDESANVNSRPQRTIVPPAKLTYLADAGDKPSPSAPLEGNGNLTIRQAMTLDPKLAVEALRAELSQMLQLEVFGSKDKQIRDRILPSKMFLKRKGSAFKARLVIGGHLQNKETMGETYSPTVNTQSVNLLLAISALERANTYTLDVSGAFLHVPLTGSPVHMKLNAEVTAILVRMAPEFVKDVSPDGCLVVRILKAIYGLGESSRQWNDHLCSTLATAGYTRLSYDSSVHIKLESGKRISLLCTHVDDLLVVDFTSDNKPFLIDVLTKAYGKVKLQDGPNFCYLGINIESRHGGFYLSQKHLIDLLEYDAPPRQATSSAPADLLDSGPSPDATSQEAFRKALMRALYIASKTRFDVLFAVTVLASRQSACTRRDEAALAQLVDWLKRTKDHCLAIFPSGHELVASADASYACHSDGHGHSGIVCRFGGSTIFARSGKQRLVAKSSTEAELLALNNATDEVLYLRNLLDELGFSQLAPTTILQDNKSAIIMAEKGELGSKRTKHFTVRHYFVAQHIRDGRIRLLHEPGTSIDADGLTKVLVGPLGRAWGERLLAQWNPSTQQRDVVSARRGVLDT